MQNKKTKLIVIKRNRRSAICGRYIINSIYVIWKYSIPYRRNAKPLIRF